MTNPLITPGLLRSVADWIRTIHDGEDTRTSVDLRQRADTLESQLAEEKRIDDLAQLFYDTATHRIAAESGWHLLSPGSRQDYRTGIRAVLENLHEKPFDGSAPK